MEFRSFPGQMNPPLPAFWFQPVLELPKPDPRYVAPLYKTSERAGNIDLKQNNYVPIIV